MGEDSGMTSLADRYGTPSPVRRRLLIAVVVVVAVAFLGWLAWVAWFHSTPAVQSKLLTYDVVDANRATAVVQVDVDDDVAATCTVRAYAADHVTVGQVAFEPVDGRNRIEVRTDRRATNVTLLGCTAPGQQRAR
jgi:hypothetical protein